MDRPFLTTEAARWLAAQRRKKPRTCAECGGAFSAFKSTVRYCSQRCRRLAARHGAQVGRG